MTILNNVQEFHDTCVMVSAVEILDDEIMEEIHTACVAEQGGTTMVLENVEADELIDQGFEVTLLDASHKLYEIIWNEDEEGSLPNRPIVS